VLRVASIVDDPAHAKQVPSAWPFTQYIRTIAEGCTQPQSSVSFGGSNNEDLLYKVPFEFGAYQVKSDLDFTEMVATSEPTNSPVEFNVREWPGVEQANWDVKIVSAFQRDSGDAICREAATSLLKVDEQVSKIMHGDEDNEGRDWEPGGRFTVNQTQDWVIENPDRVRGRFVVCVSDGEFGIGPYSPQWIHREETPAARIGSDSGEFMITYADDDTHPENNKAYAAQKFYGSSLLPFNVDITGYFLTAPDQNANVRLTIRQGADCTTFDNTLDLGDTNFQIHPDSPDGIWRFEVSLKDAADVAVNTYPGTFHACLTYANDGTYVSAGDVVVNNRPNLRSAYVLEEHHDESIEVIGSGLHYTDRIMIIECGGVCGLTGPSDEVTSPPVGDFREENDKVALWSNLSPIKTKIDDLNQIRVGQTVNMDGSPLGVVTDGPNDWGGYIVESGDGSLLCEDKYNVTVCPDPMEADTDKYTIYHNSVCLGGNIIPAEDDPRSCTNVCQSNLGYAGCPLKDHGQAYCVSQDECKQMCDELDDCSGFDIDQKQTVCFLNDALAEKECTKYDMDDGHEKDDNFDYNYWKKKDVVYLDPSAKIQFEPITIRTQGSFKLCFCDSEVTACNRKSAFNVEIAKIYVSGIHCMLENNDFTRTDTANQTAGGNRLNRLHWHEKPEPTQAPDPLPACPTL